MTLCRFRARYCRTPFTAADITLTRSLAAQADQGKGKDVHFADAYQITTTYNTEPGTYAAYVTYTVTQD